PERPPVQAQPGCRSAPAAEGLCPSRPFVVHAFARMADDKPALDPATEDAPKDESAETDAERSASTDEPEASDSGASEKADADEPAPSAKTEGEAPDKPAGVAVEPVPTTHPSYVFLVIVSVLSLAADLASKAWAKTRLEDAKGVLKRVEIIPNHISLVFAK